MSFLQSKQIESRPIAANNCNITKQPMPLHKVLTQYITTQIHRHGQAKGDQVGGGNHIIAQQMITQFSKKNWSAKRTGGETKWEFWEDESLCTPLNTSKSGSKTSKGGGRQH